MQKIFSSLSKTIDTINKSAGIFCGGLVLIMMLAVLREVVGRALFNSPTLWAVELSESLMVILSFLAGGYCALSKAHVKIDIFSDRWGYKGQARSEVAGCICGLIFVGVVLWQIYLYFLKLLSTGHTSEGGMGWPLWPIMLCCSIGALLFFLQLLSNLSRAIDNLKHPKSQKGTI
jgi:TRAP-type C4-dicarboxylate transport system permease small subunit